jgi:hypothetical protein
MPESNVQGAASVTILYATLLRRRVHTVSGQDTGPEVNQMKAWKKFSVAAFLLIAMGGTAAMAQDRNDWGERARNGDLRHDYVDRNHDRRDINRDQASIAHDRAELRHDQAVGNHYAAQRERAEIRAKERDMNRDYRDVRRDNRDIRRDHRGWDDDER